MGAAEKALIFFNVVIHDSLIAVGAPRRCFSIAHWNESNVCTAKRSRTNCDGAVAATERAAWNHAKPKAVPKRNRARWDGAVAATHRAARTHAKPEASPKRNRARCDSAVAATERAAWNHALDLLHDAPESCPPMGSVPIATDDRTVRYAEQRATLPRTPVPRPSSCMRDSDDLDRRLVHAVDHRVRETSK